MTQLEVAVLFTVMGDLVILPPILSLSLLSSPPSPQLTRQSDRRKELNKLFQEADEKRKVRNN